MYEESIFVVFCTIQITIWQKMIFSSFLFLFLFLPAVLVINRFLPVKVSNVFLLFASLLFYFVGEGTLTILLIGSILWNYLFGLLLKTEKKSLFTNKLLIGLGIAGNLSILIYFKYLGFIISNIGFLNFLPKSSYSSIILPIGISFFTFQGISYIIDVYRKVEQAEKNLIKVGLYISFFPQLIAGPIIKYHEIAKYLSHRTININQSVNGSFRFIRGLAKKIILADNFAIIVDAIFETDISALPTPLAWLGIIVYSLQIYYDFSGYSDMAIGLGLIMGFKIPENFNYPYISKSIWRRWHISLSTWFRDYLYIPLGGNRKGPYRTYFNLAIVFFITGLWHGASWNFIIWGMVHGVFLIAERIKPAFFNNTPNVLKHIYTLGVVTLAWVFFRTDTLENAISYFGRLYSFSNASDFYPAIFLNNYAVFLLLAGILLSMPVRKYVVQRYNLMNIPLNFSFVLTGTVYLSLFIYCILELSIATHTPFIYFKF